MSIEVVLGMTEAQPRLFSFLLKRLAHADQAHEVLQNVNLTICKKASQFKDGTDFVAWAFAIARFELMAFRQNQAREKLVFTDEVCRLIEQLDSSPAHQRSYGERKLALKNCLNRLSKSQKLLINRRYSDAEPVSAISAAMGKSANAVSLLLHRIRERLMICINKKLMSEIPE